MKQSGVVGLQQGHKVRITFKTQEPIKQWVPAFNLLLFHKALYIMVYTLTFYTLLFIHYGNRWVKVAKTNLTSCHLYNPIK